MRPTPPPALLRELATIGATCRWAEYGSSTYVIPLAGMPFWRRVKAWGRAHFGVERMMKTSPLSSDARVFFQYDGVHPVHGSREFEAPSQWVTPGRLVVYQRLHGTNLEEKVLDLVEENGELVPMGPFVLTLLAQRRDRWDALEAQQDKAAEKEAKELEQLGLEAFHDPIEQLVMDESKSARAWMNDPPVAKSAAGFTIIDRRVCPVSHLEP